MERRLGLPGAMLGILLCAFVMVLLGSSLAYGAPKDGEVRIHVMPYNNTDAIIVECDGKFGVVDSGEDSLSPDGADERYPLRGGITVGQGIESQAFPIWKCLASPKTILNSTSVRIRTAIISVLLRTSYASSTPKRCTRPFTAIPSSAKRRDCGTIASSTIV